MTTPPADGPVRGPVDSSIVPRYAGPATFARLPRSDEVERVDVAVLGVPFDAGVSYRPGARFGPNAIREASRLLRPYNPGLRRGAFEACQVADCGDVAANPFDIEAALLAVENAVHDRIVDGGRVVVLGGDHTIALGVLRALHRVHGPVALVHFDAHLDTWDTYFGADYTHGTPFRRAREENLLAQQAMLHIGTRGPLYAASDLEDDAAMGFTVISTDEVADRGADAIAARVRDVVGTLPTYLSIDIDVLDPAHAPGTGTPEAGGLTSRELLRLVRGLDGIDLVAADVVEVSPPYDHADITAVAAAHVAYELVTVMSTAPR